MQKSSQTLRWWDWTSIILLFLMLEAVASRLIVTEWTPSLFIIQTITYMGFAIGAILGHSHFSLKVSRWISFLYMLVLLPLQWLYLIEQGITLEEKLLSMGGRLFFATLTFFARSPVNDALFFMALVTVGFWVVSASAGFRLVREQDYLRAVLPSVVGILIIQNYDNTSDGRIWFIAAHTLLALLLLGRLHYLDNKRSWKKRRVFLSPDTSIDITGVMAIIAGILIISAWVPPTSIHRNNSAARTWEKVTKPWRELTKRMENAVVALDATPSGGKQGEFFGSEISLGRGFPLSETRMFSVQAPELSRNLKPPRYYWRGRTYNFYWDKQWYTTGTTREEYSPDVTLELPPSFSDADPSLFFFKTGDLTYSLLYAPSQAVWLSRDGAVRAASAGEEYQEVISWYASPSLIAGEAYQVNAVITNPDIKVLREAGTEYPEWVTEKYLQMPDEFSPKVAELAILLTEAYDNPYDKAAAITRYLRNNIEYTDVLPDPPRNKDPLEWMLFENQQAYCVYYSSAEILMLRSLGIPARLAVGFAQGQLVSGEYVVRKLDAHAWPEVYFPGVGWVEFEPTASQPPLNRPIPPNTQEAVDNINPDLIDFLELENNPEESLPIELDPVLTETEQTLDWTTINPAVYLLPLLVAFVALTIFIGQRYSIPVRLPTMVRNTLEKNSINPPEWIIHWERWVNISPIERSFESINFALGFLKRPVPVHATPIERAAALDEILPNAMKHTQNLLDEHQTSLYTSHKADAQRARSAAFNIRKYALLKRLRYIFEGRPIKDS